MEILSLFDSKKIKIDLLITIDAAKGFYSAQVPSSVPNIVSKNLNCYQTVPSRVGSHGHANNGTNVLNVDLSDAKDRNKKTVAHDNIDEYTAFFCVQVILYYAKGLKKLNSMSVENIKKAINTYHQNDRTR